MSRLNNRQDKQLVKTIASLIIIVILFFAFFFTFGLKILLNASSFIADLAARNKEENNSTQKTVDFFGTVNIDNILTATNSPTIAITGTVSNFDTLLFYLNGERIDEIDVSTQNSFYTEIDNLKKGDNEIFVLAETKDQKKSKRSAKYNVFYKSEKPKLVITEPSDNSKTPKSEIKLVGSTDKEIFIKVNDSPVVVDALGNFQTTVRLKEGENKIIVSFQDVAGNFEEKTISVTYEKD